MTLENFNLSHVPVYIMDEETLSAYSLYMSTLGNRPDLFSGSQYPHASTHEIKPLQSKLVLGELPPHT